MKINRKAALASSLSLLCIAASGVAALATSKVAVSKTPTKMSAKAPKIVVKTKKGVHHKVKATAKHKAVARVTKVKDTTPKARTGAKAKAL